MNTISFKLYLASEKGKGKESHIVLFKGKFSDYKTFDDLKNKIINTSQSPTFKKQKKSLNKEDIFILSFGENDSFIPHGLEQGIWDEKTYEYFLEKIKSHNLSKVNYKLFIKKVSNLPVFNKLEYHEFFQKTLKENWKEVEHEIKRDLTLPVLEEGKKNYEQKKEIFNHGLEKLFQKNHEGVICSNCYKKNFNGPRFICAECFNYNLCPSCEKELKKQEIHDRNHIFIQVNNPTPDGGNEIYNFNNFLGPREQINHTAENCFDIKLSVINTGDNDLEKCFIMAVRYGENYLSCKPYYIQEKIGKNERIDIELRIKRNAKITRGIIHGYFRMFSPNGIPFGRVVHLQNIIGE